MKKLIFVFSILSMLGYSQTIDTPSRLIFRAADPSDPCNNNGPMVYVPSTAHLFGCSSGAWTLINTAAAGVPAGSIIMKTSGTCPATYSEVAALNGVTVIGTLAANMDVGTTGGNDNLTPSGTNSAPTFTGTGGQSTSSNSAGTPSGTIGAITMSGSTAAEASHTHSVTAAGTNGTGTVTPTGTVAWPAGVPTNASGAFTQGAISWPAGVPTFAGNALGNHQHTYTDVVNHTHTVNITDPGHTHLTQRYPTATGASSGFTIDTSMSGTLADNTLPTKTNTTGITASSVNPGGGVATGTTANASAGTPAGTISWPAGVPTIAAGSFTQPTISWPAGVPTFTGGSNTTSAQTFTGSPVTSGAGSSHLHTVGTLAASTPSFTGDALGTHSHTITATGTVSAPNFTGNAADNRSAFLKVIFCSKD